jgi:hypothetical protein
MRHATLGLLAALAAVSIAGCHSSDSSDDSSVEPPPTSVAPSPSTVGLKTSEIQFSSLLWATDDVTVLAMIDFWSRTVSDTVVLGEGDALTACVGSVCQPMVRRQTNATYKPYEATLPYVAETAYTISFSRRDDVSAPNTTTTMPVPFTILTPPAGLAVTDGQAITVLWSPSGVERDTSASVRAHCDHVSGEQTSRGLSLFSHLLDRTGSAIFNMDQLMSRRAFLADDVNLPLREPVDPRVVGCRIEIEISMRRQGIPDSAFSKGYASSAIVRTLSLQYSPSQR